MVWVAVLSPKLEYIPNSFHLTAYAVYFDHRRRNDVTFRKSLNKKNKVVEKVVKEQEAAAEGAQKEEIKKALAKAKEDGWPTDLEEKEVSILFRVPYFETISLHFRSHSSCSK